MDWDALRLSVLLGLATLAVLMPPALVLARVLAVCRFPGRTVLEALLTLPLVLPPTVLGYYLLVGMAPDSLPGSVLAWLGAEPPVFTFTGLVLASVVANIPFAVGPAQRAFAEISQEVRDAAACSGLTPWQTWTRIELPLAWPGILAGALLTFAHTLGEFGVVLMVGGSIPGETRTLAIALYDAMQIPDPHRAGTMALVLLGFSVTVLVGSMLLGRRLAGRAP